MSISEFGRGSEWRKWDLHVHSPLSMLNSQFPKHTDGPNWDKYVETVENLNDVKVIGVTDYFTIEGYKKLSGLKHSANRLQNISLLLPNVEFRLNTFVASKKDGKKSRRINLHVIFSNKVDTKDIEENFLHRLDFVYKAKNNRSPLRKSLRVSNLEELGSQLKHEFPDKFRRLHPLTVGATNVTVDLADIVGELNTSDIFEGKHIIVLDEAYTDLIEWGGQDTHARMTLLQSCHMVFSSNASTRDWCLGKDPYQHDPRHFAEAYNGLKPCIHGSDAHELFFIGHPCGRREDHDCKSDSENCDLRFCWIKADPTFDGLRQVLYEPGARVRIQAKNPTPSRYNHSLSRINISESTIDGELTVTDTHLPLHHGLIAIIGGKGAGKTAFVDLIANCFKDKIKEGDRNSFVNRITYRSQPSLEVCIEFTGGDVISKGVTDATYVDVADVAYISQGELDKYIIESADLTNRVNELIFSRVTQVDKYAFGALTQKIFDTQTSIGQLSSEILALESETSPEVSQELESQTRAITATLADLQRQQNALDVDAKDIDAAQRVQEIIVALQNRRDKLTSLKETTISASSFLDEDVSKFNELVRQINSDLAGISESWSPLPEITYLESQKLSELIHRVEDLLQNTLAEIDAKESERDSLSDKASRHAELLDEVQSSTESLAEIRVNQNELQKKRDELQRKNQELVNLQKDMLECICRKQETLESIIQHFRSQHASADKSISMSSDLVLGDLDFLAEIRFDQATFLQAAEDVFDNRNTAGMDYAQNMVKYYSDFAEGNDGSISSLVDKMQQAVSNETLRARIKQNPNITLEHFRRVFQRNYFSIEPTVLYRNTRVEDLSLGQKATVLLKVYLAQGINPIIVDSHDDHLDNHFIMDELIPAIREAKKHRQVMLVSNNANVVVNSDAEQIIVAQNDLGKISYLAGSLEDPDIRAIAIKVLEGGEQAFRERQQKYRMN